MKIKLSDLEKRAEKYEKYAAKPTTSSTVCDYESQRDSYRFHTKWITGCSILSVALLIFSFAMILSEPIGNGYVTTTDGKVVQIYPYAITQR